MLACPNWLETYLRLSPIPRSRLLRIDAAQVQPRGGVATAAKLSRYFAAEGESPLRLAVMSDDVAAGITAAIAANKVPIETLLEDKELPDTDRREMSAFLAEVNHRLQASLLGRGDLPVQFD
jgi:hypothetical protein